MNDYFVAEISLAKAQQLNNNLIDDNKVAFELPSKTGSKKYLVKLSFAEENTNLISEDDIISKMELTQQQVDGTLPVVKTKRIYP